MKKSILVALALSLAAPGALAQQGSLPTQQFAPAPGGDNNYVTVQGSGTLPALSPAVGLYLNYANQPLILRRLSNGEQISLIEHQLQVDLIAAIGLFDFLEIGLGIPLTLWQAAGDNSATLQPNPLASVAMGDIRLYPKVSIVHDPKGFGLAFLAVLTLPSGSPDELQGNEGVTLEPRVVAQYQFNDEFRASITGGFLWRPEEQTLFNIDVGNEVTFGAGLEYRFDPGQFAILLEGYGKVSIESGSSSEENPIEVALAGRWWPGKPHAVTVGVARGLTDGYGAPNFRVFVGYNYTTQADEEILGDPDVDKDGVCDPWVSEQGHSSRFSRVCKGVDQCPMDPEDMDGFQDQDGCPDPDNDGDGLCDPWVAERGLSEKYAEICRGSDQCPNDAEDFDGFEDEDGCPDADNDGDGVCDPWVVEQNLAAKYATTCKPSDQCPNEPEDMDGFQDDDGCPDPDNDGDGILDVDDPCPNDPTNKCGVEFNPCEIVITEQVFFRYDKFEIDPKSFPLLDAVADVIRSQEWIKLLEVQGHTDTDGTREYNLTLSQNRAQAVLDYLVGKGVAAGKLRARGYSFDKPIATNKTADGRAKNRRVQFIIIDPSQEQCAK